MKQLLNNKLLKILSLYIAFLIPSLAFSQSNNGKDSLRITDPANYTLPKPFSFVKNVPKDIAKIFSAPFHERNLGGFLITLGTTVILLPYDQDLSKEVKRFCERNGLASKEDFNSPVRFKDARIIKIPQNLNSAFYQLGEGGTSMFVAGGLYLFGKINHDNKSICVASDLTESLITMGVVTQVLKRVTGRETPLKATTDGGEWRPFPAFTAFQKNTPNYDSYPSGHLASMSATVSTLILNYPEKNWIKVVGCSLVGLSGLSMMNNDVHWISDYPLAIALGYLSAKITFNRNHKMPIEKIIPVN